MLRFSLFVFAADLSIIICRMYFGMFMSSLDMSGFQISILNVTKNSHWLEFLDQSTDAPGWPATCISIPLPSNCTRVVIKNEDTFLKSKVSTWIPTKTTDIDVWRGVWLCTHAKWPHWHHTPLPGIATTGLRWDKGGNAFWQATFLPPFLLKKVRAVSGLEPKTSACRAITLATPLTLTTVLQLIKNWFVANNKNFAFFSKLTYFLRYSRVLQHKTHNNF